jgi:acyl-[acyl-carrier-protein]-phospholipid O-acyltransferase/long-chain-fatty-acid--[acyl-carrier-protein] ligase
MLAEVVCSLVRVVCRVVYRLRITGVERLPATGPVLLVPNHVSYIDVVLLQIACPRTIRFLTHTDIVGVPWLNGFFRAMNNTIPVNPTRAKEAIAAAVEALGRGEVVCVFAEGALTRAGLLMKLQRGYELIARRADAPVLPVWLDDLWDSIFSVRGDKAFWKWPRRLPYPASIHFGTPLSPAEATSDVVRQQLYDLGEAAFSDREELKSHLGWEAMKGLKKKFREPVITDTTQNNRTLSRGKLLALGLTLADWLRTHIPDKRVGIVLPPGIGCTAANLACLLADKVPVNLNFTAGPAAIEAAIRKAGLNHALSAEAMVAKLGDTFPWPATRHDLSEVVKSIPRAAILFRFVLAAVLPASLLRLLARVPTHGDHAEASLLFTSGSSGEPKGVPLTHRNIIANVRQVEAVLPLGVGSSVLGCLPIFHSFGATVTLWWPLLGGIRVITYPNPMDTARLAELVEEHKISLMATTPTFLRGLMRKAKPEQLKSLVMIVTGAEKLPDELRADAEAKLGVAVCQGYGMTEGSPVVSTNLTNRPPLRPGDEPLIGKRDNSSGRFVPGISVRIRDPETNADRSVFEVGMLWLKGANLFEGYLDDPVRTADVVQDGWYKTGDLARLDEDGFLFIEGRLSRFSKIAGEMVPHGTVESRIHAVLGDIGDGGVSLVVTSIPDEAKGEALVLLTTHDVDMQDLRKKLLEAGTPALWIPKIVKKVEHIPVLATGKLDLQGCQRAAAA